MSRSAHVQQRLERAATERLLVRVRFADGWERCMGYVAGVGTKWVGISAIDDGMRANGFNTVRLCNIVSVTRAKAGERFARRCLELDQSWPPAPLPAGVDLNRTGGVIAGLTAAFPLIAVHIEREDPDVCFIGRPQCHSGKTMLLREVDPNAEWSGPRREDWSRWRYGELTRINAGGAYESALARVAGPPPA